MFLPLGNNVNKGENRVVELRKENINFNNPQKVNIRGRQADRRTDGETNRHWTADGQTRLTDKRTN